MLAENYTEQHVLNSLHSYGIDYEKSNTFQVIIINKNPLVVCSFKALKFISI